MKKKQDRPADVPELRRRAEERLKRQSPAGGRPRAEVETARTVHELQVHQIELEMQNEELQQARAQVETLLAQYTDLYEFAPAGYLTLDREGAIRQVNLTGARLFGVERSQLVNRRFGAFVAESDRRAFSDFLVRVFARQANECCEVTLPREGLQPLVVGIEGTRSADGQECRAVVLDITERKQAEEALSRALSGARCILWEAQARTQGDYHDWKMRVHSSDLTNRVFGLERLPGELDNQMWSRHILPDDHARMNETCDAALKSGAPGYEQEFRFRAASGEYRWLKEDVKITRSAPGVFDLVGVCVDITERKRAEEALRRAASDYRTLAENLPDLLARFDSGLRHVYVNPAAARAGALSAEQYLGKTIAETGVPAPSAKEWEDRIRAVFLTGEPLNVEGEFVTSEGPRYFHTTLVPERAEDGSVQSVLSLARDVTARKRGEESLRASEARFRALFEQAGDIILLLEAPPDGIPIIRDANAAASRLLGYAHDELLGQPVSFIEAEPQTEDLIKERRRGILTGATSVFEVKHRRKDGAVFEVECSIKKIHVGSKTFAFSIERDITARKRAEEALRESEERHRTILQTAMDGCWLADLQGRLIDVNGTYCRMSGYSREELLALTIAQLEVEESPDDVAAHIEQLKTVGSARFESRQRRKDGSVYDVEVSANYVPGIKGGRLVTFLRDITERKHFDEQLRQAHKMEAVGQLAGGVAHDFNNLLFVVNGRADLALRRLKPDDPLREQLEIILGAGQRAAALTRQLLAFSRRQILQPKVLDLNGIVSNLEKMLHRLIREDIALTTVLDPALEPTKADPGQIEQVLMNLVVNARDAMPTGGKLVIGTANAQLDETFCRLHDGARPGRYVVLSVTDSGSGMDAQAKAHLFEPFFTTKKQGEGTGLGLATVYGIVKQSGGYIEVESKEGKGSTFRILLPQAKESAEAVRAAAPSSESRRARGTILLAEDVDAVREVVRDMLEAEGYCVLSARQGAEALALAEQHQGPLHLLLTDVVMPEMSGPELAQRLARLRPELKVLFMSGYTDAAIADEGALGSGSNYIQKPVSAEELARKLRELLEEQGHSQARSV